MTFKTFKSFSAARKFANGKPIVHVGNIYLAPEGDDPVSLRLTEVSIIAANGNYCGLVTLSHLNRLGNANHAAGGKGWDNYPNAFPAA